jgi:hypothetical protein
MQPADGTYILCEILFVCLLLGVLLNARKSTLYEVNVWSVRYPHKSLSPEYGDQVCITKAKWTVLEKVAVRNDIGSDYLKKGLRFEPFRLNWNRVAFIIIYILLLFTFVHKRAGPRCFWIYSVRRGSTLKIKERFLTMECLYQWFPE